MEKKFTLKLTAEQREYVVSQRALRGNATRHAQGSSDSTQGSSTPAASPEQAVPSRRWVTPSPG